MYSGYLGIKLTDKNEMKATFSWYIVIRSSIFSTFNQQNIEDSAVKPKCSCRYAALGDIYAIKLCILQCLLIALIRNLVWDGVVQPFQIQEPWGIKAENYPIGLVDSNYTNFYIEGTLGGKPTEARSTTSTICIGNSYGRQLKTARAPSESTLAVV